MSDIDTQDTNVTPSEDFATSLQLESNPSATDTATDTTETQPAEGIAAESVETTTPAETTEELQPGADSTINTEATETDGQPAEETTEAKGLTRAERVERYGNIERDTSQHVRQVISDAYQPQDVTELRDQYIEQGADEFQALQLARQDVADQRVQIAEAATEISQLNANIQVDAVEARAMYPWMNPQSPEYDNDTAQAAAKLFELGATIDPRTKQIVDIRMSPSQIGELLNKARTSGNTKAQMQGQKNAEQQMAAVAPTTSSKPTAVASADDKQATDLMNAFNTV